MSPLKIVEKGVSLYERYFAHEDDSLNDQDETLKQVVPDPFERSVFRKVMKALGQLSTKNLTTDQIRNRNKAGGEARAKALTKEQRQEIARKGGPAPRKKAPE